VTAEPVTVAAGQRSAALKVTAADGAAFQAFRLRIYGEARLDGESQRRLATSVETYNIQGTAFPRDLAGPVLVVTGLPEQAGP
jgi:hypothetical protein